jgi:ABC-type amino acid transport substrate-binding protein
MRRLLVLVAALLPAMTHAQTTDKTLQRIRDGKAITIAYRTDAPPFSYEANGQPAGYSVELCKRIVTSLEQQLKVPTLTVKWVPANVQTRLDLVRKGQVDLECGTPPPRSRAWTRWTSPISVGRRDRAARPQVSGRPYVGEPGGQEHRGGGGTPNAEALEDALKKGLVNAKVLPAKSYDEAIALLEGGKADALAAGKVMLVGMGSKLKDTSLYELLDDDIGYVPYAIVLPLGANGLRTAVNRALSRIYGSDAIFDVFRGAFGGKASLALVISNVSTPIQRIEAGSSSSCRLRDRQRPRTHQTLPMT